MIEFIRLAIIIVGIITIMLGLSRRTYFAFDKVVNIAAALLVIHAAHALYGGLFMAGRPYFEIAAPYGLMYGPLLFFALGYSLQKRISKRMVLIHSSPFVLMFLFYLLIMTVPFVRENYIHDFLKILYSLLPLSFLGYSLWACFYKGAEGIRKIRASQKLINVSSMILLVMAGFLITVKYTKEEQASEFVAPIIYLIMLLASFILLLYNSINPNHNRGFASRLDESQMNKDPFIPKLYKKSAVGEDLLMKYEQKLHELLEVEKIYLDPELNLMKTAAKLKVPQHHLTQVVNLRFDRNFNQLINSFRVKHACRVMRNNRENLKMEELAFRSGFNSRISFNRNFKKEMGCSPTEYLNKYRDQKLEGISQKQ